jgi:UDP-glucose 4-epimerase
VSVRDVNILDYAALKAAFTEARPEVVIHLAAIHYIPECNADPEGTLQINVTGTQTVLRAARETGVRRVVATYSGAVYADSPALLHEASPVGCVDIYAWSKWFCEELGAWHAKPGEMEVAMVRLFNTYGPRETNHHIVPEIVAQLRRGPSLSLGNTSAVRDYIHVRDVARGFLAVAGATLPSAVETVNLCTGRGTSVDDIVRTMGELLGRPIPVSVDPARFRPVDKAVQVGDPARLTALSGWKPEIELRAGLEELLQFEGLL